jgi:uncharacterized membrane protein YphA (DoxX/SURF4 family)
MKGVGTKAGSIGKRRDHKNLRFYGKVLLLLRFLLAAVFIYAAIQKIDKPLAFSDEIRMYGIADYGPLLYLLAIVLPWLELVCGLCLLTGIYLHGAAFILTGLNAIFITVITVRTVNIMHAGTPLLKVYFDCGCGFGATYAWKKLLENAVLFFMTGGLLFYLLHRGSFSSTNDK